MTKFFKGKRYILLLLFSIGLAFRLIGLFYMGNQNLFSYREIGHNVRTKGLAESYGEGYFPIAFLIFGLNDYLSSYFPFPWWWSYKASNLVFELVILATLLALFKQSRAKVLILFWLNPWFLIPGSWQGFWDAPYMVFLLWSVLILDSKLKSKLKFLLSGLALSFAISVKPQTVAPLAIVGLYFLKEYLIKFKFRQALVFSASLLFLPGLFTIYFFLKGKPFLFLPKWYAANLFYSMPFLVNSEINIWHFVTRVIMFFKGISGPIYSLNVYIFPYNLLEYLAFTVFFVFLLAFVIKGSDKNKKLPSLFFTKAFTFASFLLPQLGTRSHAYHIYSATILLLIILLKEYNGRLFFIWLGTILIHFYNIFWQYGLGPDVALPITAYGEPFLSFLGLAQFFITIYFIYVFLGTNRKKFTFKNKLSQ